jgi:hypothetical protein
MSRSIGTWAFNKNDRIRAVIAWNNCATNGVDSPPLPVVELTRLRRHSTYAALAWAIQWWH